MLVCRFERVKNHGRQLETSPSEIKDRLFYKFYEFQVNLPPLATAVAVAEGVGLCTHVCSVVNMHRCYRSCVHHEFDVCIVLFMCVFVSTHSAGRLPEPTFSLKAGDNAALLGRGVRG